MTKSIIFTASFLCFLQASGQNLEMPTNFKNPSLIFKNFTGFRERIRRVDNQVRWAYTIAGKEYEIYVLPLDYRGTILGKKGTMDVNAKTIKKNADFFTMNLEGFTFLNAFSSRISKVNDTISATMVSYLFPDSKDSLLYSVRMVTFFQRDSTLEKNIVRDIHYNGIYDSIFLSPERNFINFAGKLVKIDSTFFYAGPNDIYCPRLGQMNWSEHQNLYQANVMRDVQMLSNEHLKQTELIKKDTISVLFENVIRPAIRAIYKANVPRIFWGRGSKTLVVYYVISMRNNRFITTVLSHYDDQLINGDVPPPLNSIMSIKNSARL